MNGNPKKINIPQIGILSGVSRFESEAMLKHSISAIVLIFIVSSCAKDIDIFIPDETTIPPGTDLITSNLSGIVLDELALPVGDAFIQFGSSSTFSDGNGVFFIKDAEVQKDRAQVQLEVPGYFPGLPTIYAEEEGTFFLQVNLRSRTEVASFPATDLAAIDAGEGLSFMIEENSLLDPNGDDYQGTVHAFATVYDCTEIDQFKQLPGNGIGHTLAAEEVVLAPYIGFTLEFEGNPSELLESKPGQAIFPTIEIPASMQSTAPDELSVWNFDVDKGWWAEIGTAIREGDTYVCEVETLGNLLLAASYPFIEIEGICLDDEGRPIGHQALCMQLEDGNFSALAYTALTGDYRFRIPANVAQDLHLLNDCGEALYTTLLGELPTNTALPPIILDSGNGFETWLNGTVTDCNENPLPEGYLLVRQADWVRPVILDELGNFRTHLSSCSADTYELQAQSFAESETRSLKTSHPFFAEMTFGNLNACDAIPETFTGFTLDSDNYYSSTLSAVPEAGITSIFDGNSLLSLQVPGETEGMYVLEPQNVNIGGYTSDQISSSDIVVVIDFYGASGETVWGSINGTFTDLDGNQHLVFGQFSAVVP